MTSRRECPHCGAEDETEHHDTDWDDEWIIEFRVCRACSAWYEVEFTVDEHRIEKIPEEGTA